MGDLIWVRIFFFETAGDRIFFLTYNGVRFFFQHYTPWKIYFFSVGIFYGQVLPCKNFFSSKSVCRIFFFWNHPYPPKKSNVRPLSTFCFSSVLKIMIIALENCFIQISRYSCAYITHNLWKDKRANFPETFIGKTKHQGPKLTCFLNILKLFLKNWNA